MKLSSSSLSTSPADEPICSAITSNDFSDAYLKILIEPIALLEELKAKST